jgi:alkanesulfonate monooxygenase SsuD/methylene tetrahydromethanopterin reductase-like flavin-dependent oxidoreductase (luciferase family)
MDDARIGFGLFLAPFHALGESPTLALERDLELISWVDTLGYDEAWVGEHHRRLPLPSCFWPLPPSAHATFDSERGRSASPITTRSWSRTGSCCSIT